jgi:hypothetical protein
MTDEQRKSVVVEYLKAFDKAGVRPDGSSILDLFADDALVYFPKWGLAHGKEQIGKMFGDVGATIRAITHDYSHFNCHGAGYWCDVFEIRDWKIQRCFIYLDPDYAGKDTARYPWLKKS